MNTELSAVNPETVREIVKERYGAAARQVTEGSKEGASSCCGSMCCTSERDPITVDLYDESETAGLPVEAVLASLGCGNPTALAELAPGEVVLDLGSGGGIDVLLSARRVGPTGKAYGLDMTDDMLELARENQRRAGVENVEFLKGEIEAVPLPDAAVDVIISNCVINLAADKGKVLAEAFRVLRPGGRFAVADIVLRGELPEAVRQSFVAWTGCVAGALQETEYRSLLAAAGFEEIEIEPTRVYDGKDIEPFLASAGLDASLAGEVDGKAMSAFVRAKRPR
jgi:SAM-dependent methyltransferase